MDGILNINKPAGETSFGVVAAVRRICHERRVGHAGTLDPLATGVLPVCLGKATRVAEYLMEHPKQYRATIEFGITTDSGDADGRILAQGDATRIQVEALHAALSAFHGQIEQTPPMFSALKHRGQPLYELARAGITVERSSRTVQIYDLRLVSWERPVLVIEVTCSRGTYIRTIAEDLGKALGCGAYLKHLCRLEYGPFSVENSLSLAQLVSTVADGGLPGVLHSLDSVLMHLLAIDLNAELEDSMRHGRPLPQQLVESEPPVGASEKGRLRAYNLDGCFLGVLRFNSEKHEWQPEKVFS